MSVATRAGTAPDQLTAELEPGLVTVLTGPNGCGKSTTVQAILGLIAPDEGAVFVDGTDVRELDLDSWWSRIAWLPQRPVLVPGTLRENVELLGAIPDPTVDDLRAVSAATGFESVLAELPDGWNTVVGQNGTGLSLGQRQRLALTRVLAAHRPILLLDEPTAHLDPESEQRVLTTLREYAAAGATVVVVAHRPTVLAAGDVVIEVVAAHTPSDVAPDAVPTSNSAPGTTRPTSARTVDASDPVAASEPRPGADSQPRREAGSSGTAGRAYGVEVS